MALTLYCVVSLLKSLVFTSLSFGLGILDVGLAGLGVLCFLHVLLRVVVDLPPAPPAGKPQRVPQVRSPEPAASEPSASSHFSSHLSQERGGPGVTAEVGEGV